MSSAGLNFFNFSARALFLGWTSLVGGEIPFSLSPLVPVTECELICFLKIWQSSRGCRVFPNDEKIWKIRENKKRNILTLWGRDEIPRLISLGWFFYTKLRVLNLHLLRQSLKMSNTLPQSTGIWAQSFALLRVRKRVARANRIWSISPCMSWY